MIGSMVLTSVRRTYKIIWLYTLKRLGTDYVDLYQPARINPHIPVEDTIGAVLRRHTYASGSYQGQRIDL